MPAPRAAPPSWAGIRKPSQELTIKGQPPTNKKADAPPGEFCFSTIRRVKVSFAPHYSASCRDLFDR